MLGGTLSVSAFGVYFIAATLLAAVTGLVGSLNAHLIFPGLSEAIRSGEPTALLLDEPFAALDRRLRQRLRDELAELQAALKLPMLTITHDDDDVRALRDGLCIERALEAAADRHTTGAGRVDTGPDLAVALRGLDARLPQLDRALHEVFSDVSQQQYDDAFVDALLRGRRRTLAVGADQDGGSGDLIGQRGLFVDFGGHAVDEHRGQVVQRDADRVVTTAERVVHGAARDSSGFSDGGEAELPWAQTMECFRGGGEQGRRDCPGCRRLGGHLHTLTRCVQSGQRFGKLISMMARVTPVWHNRTYERRPEPRRR